MFAMLILTVNYVSAQDIKANKGLLASTELGIINKEYRHYREINNSEYSKNWGIGLRLGDPAGISIKKYIENGKALELNFGRTSLWGIGRYNGRFNDLHIKYSHYKYEDFHIQSAFSIQLHYLFHKNVWDINGLEDFKGLQWYYGFGGQLRIINIKYYYEYYDIFWRKGVENVTDIDLGGDGVVGLEYTFEDVPISLFLDLNLFVELFDNPLLIWFQSGIGVRYNF